MRVVVLGYNYHINYKRVWRFARVLSKYFDVIYVYKSSPHLLHIENALKEKYPSIKFVGIEKKGIRGISRWFYDREIIDAVLSYSPDVIYIHYFPFFMPLVLFREAKRRGIRIVYDVHELIPWQAYAPWVGDSRLLEFIRRLIVWNVFYHQLSMADHIVWVSYSTMLYVSRVLANINILKKSTVISNLADDIVPQPLDKEHKVVYVGYGLRRIPFWFLKSLHDKWGYDFEYVAAQEEPSLSGYSWIRYVPFMPYEEMMAWLARAKWSLVTYDLPVSELKNYMYTIPNKFFDSIGVFTPVLVRSHFYEVSRITKRYGVGMVGELEELVSLADGYGNAYQALLENIMRYRKYFVWNEFWERKLLLAISGESLL